MGSKLLPVPGDCLVLPKNSILQLSMATNLASSFSLTVANRLFLGCEDCQCSHRSLLIHVVDGFGNDSAYFSLVLDKNKLLTPKIRDEHKPFEVVAQRSSLPMLLNSVRT